MNENVLNSYSCKKDRKGGYLLRKTRAILLFGCCFMSGLFYTANASGISAFGDMGGVKLSQEKTVMFGVVLDANGLPIPGASVFVKGSQNGMSTDIDGKFSIEFSPADKLLVVSFIGMQTREIPLKQGEHTIVLQEDKQVLDEVVVTGYQTISKERTTGSYAILKSDKIQENIQPNLANRLEGLVAGVVVDNRGNVEIRGVSSLEADKNPLIVLDGVPYEGGLSSINHADIKSITVLKDAAASSIYGAKAANGVIVVVSKKGTDSNGKVNVSFSANNIFEPKPDFAKLNLLNSAEVVDLQLAGLENYKALWQYLGNDPRLYDNPLFLDYKKMQAGGLSKEDFDKNVAMYKGQSNRSQLEDFTRSSIQQNYTLSISGGNEKNNFYSSLNYISNDAYLKENNGNSVKLYLRDDLNLFKWLKSYISLSGKIGKSKESLGFSPIGEYMRRPAYLLLQDKNGKDLNFNTLKSQQEVDRLIGLNLQNENFYPFQNYDKEYSEGKSKAFIINMGLNFTITDGLNFDFRYEKEFYDTKNKEFWSADSYRMSNLINDATTVADGVHNIPLGGRLQQTLSDGSAYTLRGQLDYNKTFGKHAVTALLGGERRRTLYKTNRLDLFGYDELSLFYQPLNYDLLKKLNSGSIETQGARGSLGESFTPPRMQEQENRFVSFYGNVAYTFDEKYTFNGSIRTDQSNLFGSDPKYRYANSSFPVLVIEDQGVDRITKRKTAIIYGNQAPNPSIRWEKTVTQNFGVDFSVLANRLNFSLDLYHKKTTDLLGRIKVDPTVGFKNAFKNYGTMLNKGVELGLNGAVIDNKDFKWNSAFTFSYNKNKLQKVEGNEGSVFDIANFGGYNKEDYPMRSLFSFRYAGLDKEGKAMYFNAKDEKVYEIDSPDDLVYSGTTAPPYVASWTNSFSYKDFTLSLMFSYYGGHKMRLPKAQPLSIWDIYEMNTVLDRDILNRWQGKIGDDVTPNFIATYDRNQISNVKRYWAFSDRNTAKADFIKMRNIALTYRLPKSLISKVHLQSCSLTLQATNLLSWFANDEGVDPEYLSNYGDYVVRNLHLGEKTFSLGLNINF